MARRPCWPRQSKIVWKTFSLCRVTLCSQSEKSVNRLVRTLCRIYINASPEGVKHARLKPTPFWKNCSKAQGKHRLYAALRWEVGAWNSYPPSNWQQTSLHWPPGQHTYDGLHAIPGNVLTVVHADLSKFAVAVLPKPTLPQGPKKKPAFWCEDPEEVCQCSVRPLCSTKPNNNSFQRLSRKKLCLNKKGFTKRSKVSFSLYLNQ